MTEYHSDYSPEVQLEAVFAKLQKARENPGQLPGQSTGFKSLDAITDGLQPGQLWVIGARSSMGKTTLASNIAFNVARHEPVGFLSLEQPAGELWFRIISECAEIPMRDLKRGLPDNAQWAEMLELKERLKTRRLYFADAFDRELDKLRAAAADLKDRHDIQLLFLDFLQLASAKDVRTRDLEIAQVVNGFKHLALDMEIPVVITSQLNREVEKRSDKRPTLADLRESGSIEAAGDIVCLLYREQYYFERKPKPDVLSPEYQKWQEDLNRCHGKAEINIAKNRNGPSATIELTFDGKRFRFSDLYRGAE